MMIYFKECSDDAATIDYLSSNFCDVIFPTFDFENKGSIFINTTPYQDWMNGDYELYLEHVDDPSQNASVNVYQQTLLID